MENQYHYELCWLIKEFSRKNESAKQMVGKFIKVNGLSCVEDCKDIMALETVLRVEMFISERGYVK